MTRTETTGNSNESADDEAPASSADETNKKLFRHSSSSFMRATDLGLCHSLGATPDELQAVGVEDNDDLWITLDEGERSRESLPLVVEKLTRFALELIHDESVWTPANKKTVGLLSSSLTQEILAKEVLLWVGKLNHGGYGSELPCIKSRGIVRDQSPRELAELLCDSSRVSTYNKMSKGRTDVLVLSLGLDQGETKIIKSVNKPPLVRKMLEFVSLLHARKLTKAETVGGHEGYIVVGRAVTRKDEDDSNNNKKKGAKNEILLNVHLLLESEGGKNTEMINVNHMKSGLVPKMVAKNLGMSSAVSFINDIRALSK